MGDIFVFNDPIQGQLNQIIIY